MEKITTAVFYKDANGKQFTALMLEQPTEKNPKPASSIVYVDAENQGDQISSGICLVHNVPHKENQPAYGKYWRELTPAEKKNGVVILPASKPPKEK